jgi:hypothetical protein
LLPGLLLAVSACASEPESVIAGNTTEEMQLSLIRIGRTLPPARKDEFERAVETMILSASDRRLGPDSYRLSSQAMAMLKGRTVNDVIEGAKLIRSASAY